MTDDRQRRRSLHLIRPIEPRDREQVAALIRTVMPEFGASGPGFAIQDPEVDDMIAAYQAPRARYFVVVRGSDVVGGGGVAPLEGGDDATCELRKMYFQPEVRGLGLGQELLDGCLASARQAGFRRMYIETLARMDRARALYERNGFVRLAAPLGHTGHFGCDAYYAREL